MILCVKWQYNYWPIYSCTFLTIFSSFQFQLIVRLLPGRVQLLLLDFIDTGIDVNYDEVELPLVEDWGLVVAELPALVNFNDLLETKNTKNPLIYLSYSPALS